MQLPDRIRAVVADAGIREWIASDVEDTRDLIVEAALAPRAFTFDHTSPGNPTPQSLLGGEDRSDSLDRIARDLESVIGSSVGRLRAAGAIVAVVTPEQARRIAEHPDVKAIRANRTLGAS